MTPIHHPPSLSLQGLRISSCAFPRAHKANSTSNCNPNIQYLVSDDTQAVTGINVRADGDSCGTPVPVTLPGDASASGSDVVVDQVGSEPVIVWTPLDGSAVELTFNEPVPL